MTVHSSRRHVKLRTMYVPKRWQRNGNYVRSNNQPSRITDGTAAPKVCSGINGSINGGTNGSSTDTGNITTGNITTDRSNTDRSNTGRFNIGRFNTGRSNTGNITTGSNNNVYIPVHRRSDKLNYICIIYEHIDDNMPTSIKFSLHKVYDVKLYITATEPNMEKYNEPGLKIVYTTIVKSARKVSMGRITKYLHWKFAHCQRQGCVRSDNTFTLIDNDLDWIRSVIDVELDYHVGIKECLLKRNEAYLSEYRKTCLSGYGPQFCDPNPLNNISNSRLVRYLAAQ